jgi:hypothetical protein
MFSVLSEAGKPMVGHNLWDIPDAIQPDLYSTDPGTLPMATVLMEYLVFDLGMESIAIVTTDSPFGRDTVDFLGFLLGEYGAESQGVFYDEGTADYLPAFAAVDLATVDGLIFLPFTVGECGPASDALAALGWDKPIIASDFCSAEAYAETGQTEGWLFILGTDALIEGAADRQLLLDIFEGFDGPASIDGFVAPMSMHTFFVIEVLEDAYALAGSAEAITSDHIRQAATEWSGHLTLGPDTMTCPGPEPFVAVCNSAAKVALQEGGVFIDLTGWRIVDMALYAPLLEE